jgi:hypothetical protein
MTVAEGKSILVLDLLGSWAVASANAEVRHLPSAIAKFRRITSALKSFYTGQSLNDALRSTEPQSPMDRPPFFLFVRICLT